MSTGVNKTPCGNTPTCWEAFSPPHYPLMIRYLRRLSAGILCPACESEVITLNYLILAKKIVPWICLFRPCANLRSCSKKREQNALCRGIRGLETETSANAPNGVASRHKRADAKGTSASPRFVVRLSHQKSPHPEYSKGGIESQRCPSFETALRASSMRTGVRQ